MYFPDCLDLENNIEEICYQQSHIDKVWEEMETVIPTYFQRMIETDCGHLLQNTDIEKLAAKFGATSKPKAKTKDPKMILERLFKGNL